MHMYKSKETNAHTEFLYIYWLPTDVRFQLHYYWDAYESDIDIEGVILDKETGHYFN